MLFLKIALNFSAVMIKMLKIKQLIGPEYYPMLLDLDSHSVYPHYTHGDRVCRLSCSCCLDLLHLRGV